MLICFYLFIYTLSCRMFFVVVGGGGGGGDGGVLLIILSMFLYNDFIFLFFN